MNTPAENRAALDRPKGRQPNALRTHGGFYVGPTHKTHAAKPAHTQAPRATR